MAETLIRLIKDNAELLGSNLRRFFEIIARPSRFIASIDHSAGDTLISASLFAVLMSLLNVAFHLPTFRLLGVEAESVSFIVADTVLTFGFFFLNGTCFHFAAKVLRAKGSYVSTLVSYLYLTAFFPVITLVSIPLEVIVRRHMIEGTDTYTADYHFSILRDVLSAPAAMASLVAAIALIVWYFAALASVLRVVHGTGRFRAVAVALFGSLLWMALSLSVEMPAFQLLWKAFRSAA